MDVLDPRYWDEPLPWVPIYLDNTGDYFALVSEPDYKEAMSFVWALQYSSDIGRRWRAGEDVRKRMYAARNIKIGGKSKKELLHRWVMRKVPPPSERHVIVDHMNGCGLDCRRENLRWVTPLENNRNRHGFYVKQRRFEYA